jgi:oligo-1,6-glucosidase
MQWTDGEHAGFTDGEPWIGVNPNHDEINVEAARTDPESVFHYYRELIGLREHDVVVYGDYEQLTPDDETVWAYTRTLEGDDWTDRLLVVLNWSGEAATFTVPDAATDGLDPDAEATLLLGNDADDVAEAGRPTGTLELSPWEARVYRFPPA